MSVFIEGVGVLVAVIAAIVAVLALVAAREQRFEASREAADALKSAETAAQHLANIEKQNKRASDALSKANEITLELNSQSLRRERGRLAQELAVVTIHLFERYRLGIAPDPKQIRKRRASMVAVTGTGEDGCWHFVSLLHLFTERARRGEVADPDQSKLLIMQYADSWADDPGAFIASFSEEQIASTNSELMEHVGKLKAETEAHVNQENR